MLDDIEIRAIKTGMLFDASNTHAVANTLRAHYAAPERPLPPLVVDPVSVSTSGHTLLHPDAVEVMISELLPLAALVTPNKPEAELLLCTVVGIHYLSYDDICGGGWRHCAVGGRSKSR